jgi:hypothetical protein
MNLSDVAQEISRRLCKLFLPDSSGWAPWQGDDHIYSSDPHWRGLLHFNEYFHADTGRGCGASHQTGWTALIARCLKDQFADDAGERSVTAGSKNSTEPMPPPEVHR